jgi:hypothetical protein
MEESGLRHPGLGFGILFLLVLTGASGALDLRVSGGIGNLSFDKKEESFLDTEIFAPTLYPYGSIGLEGDYSDFADFSAAFEIDPILRNRLLANAGFNLGYIRIDIGPFIGLFNTEEQKINSGISAGMGVEFPGIAFGSVAVGSTIGSLTNKPGEYIQHTGDISIGVWVPHVVCTFSLNEKSYTGRVNDELITKDESIRYQLRADMFSKNVPYTIRIDMGYQSLTRSYIPQGSAATVYDPITFEFDSVPSDTDEFRSIYFGFEGTYRIVPKIQIVLGAEMPVFSWGKTPLGSPDKETFFYQAHVGLVWTLPEKVK